ncbi:hypothetical protein niasHT_030054 [Heterodera trifolii]|uniref:Uncharacterized protein n=1 Tax=Heterodera trifolii TaxID=157864 RepID=A0ABD2JQF0_9BILA
MLLLMPKRMQLSSTLPILLTMRQRDAAVVFHHPMILDVSVQPNLSQPRSRQPALLAPHGVLPAHVRQLQLAFVSLRRQSAHTGRRTSLPRRISPRTSTWGFSTSPFLAEIGATTVRCAAFMGAMSAHIDKCALASLRQLIAQMKKYAVGAKENLAHSRGVGIAVQVPKPWPVAEEDGWTGVTIPGCDEKSPVVKPAVAEPRKPKKQTLPKVVPDKRQPWLCNNDGRPIPGLAPVEKALPVAPLRKVATDMPRPKNVYHTMVKGKAVTASKLLELSKTDKPRVPIGYAPIAGAGKPALQNRPVLNAVPKPVLCEPSEEMFVVGRKVDSMEKAKKMPDVVKKVPTVHRRRTVWNSSSVSFVVPCFYVLQQYIKATTPAVASSAPALKSSSLSYAQALKKPLPSKPRAVVASAPAIANKPRLEAPRINEEPNWQLFVGTGTRRNNITTTPNAPMLPLLQKTYAEVARTLKETKKKPLSATARKTRQFFLGDFFISKGVTGTTKSDRCALTTAEAAPKRQRGGGSDSSRSATPTAKDEQHAFFLDCFQRSPEQKQEAF